jgi:PAS domain S-box-containing protein
LVTEALGRRPTREPDFAAENDALTAIAAAMDEPDTILQTLVHTTMEICRADSAGICVLEPDHNGDVFRWTSVTGVLEPLTNQVTPRENSLWDLVVKREALLLFSRPGDYFDQTAEIESEIVEILIAPFFCQGSVVGTLWVATHARDNVFDAECARVLDRLSRFTSAGYQLIQARNESLSHQHALEQQIAERNRRAMEISSVGIIFFTADGRLTGANDTFLRMSGYTREDLATNRIRWDKMTPPEWMPATHEVIDELFNHGLPTTYEKEYIRKDGSRWWGLFAGATISDGEAVEYIIDISDAKETEQQLAESEERFRAMISQTTVGIAQGDLEGHITFVNEGMANLLGYTEEELFGRHFLDITHPEDIEESRTRYNRLFNQGIPFRYEKRYLRKDGSSCWVSNNVSPIRSEDGEVRALVSLSVDITARIKAESELREQEEHLTALVDITSDGLYRMSADWSIMYELQGGTFLKATLIPKHDWLDDYIHPDDQEHVLQVIRQSIRSKAPFELEHRVRLADGSLGWVLSKAIPVLDQEGEIKFWLGAVSNLTARKRAEETLRLNESRLSERVASATSELRSLSRQLLRVQEAERRHIAHELHDEIGQALTGLRFSLEMANRSVDSQHLQDAITTTEYLADQVRSLTLELRPPVLDDIGLIPALLALTNRFSSQVGIKVDLFHEGGNRRFPSDIETTAYRVAQEALTNVARHASADRATIQVVVNKSLNLSITDNGTGFDVNEKRGNGNTSGMTGMQERASQVGGTITIESAPEGGTTVSLDIPLEEKRTPTPRSE